MAAVPNQSNNRRCPLIPDIAKHQVLMETLRTSHEWVCIDGPVDPVRYQSVSPRVLWVLREANGSHFDFLDYCRNPTVNTHWKKSFGLVVKVSYGIIHNIRNYGDIPRNAEEIVGVLKSVAIVNVNKNAGGPNVDWSRFPLAVRGFSDLLREQVDCLAPNILIFGGTRDVLGRLVVDIAREMPAVRCVDAYHPGQRKYSHETYFNHVIGRLAT